MRMWLVPTECLCRKHLLGEHVELHMLLGCLKRNKNIKGYIDKQLLFPEFVVQRHWDVANEMRKRGYNHKSSIELIDAPIPQFYQYKDYDIELVKNNMVDLYERCEACRELIEPYWSICKYKWPDITFPGEH